MDMKGVKVVSEVLHLTLLVLPKRLELARYLLPMGLFRRLLPGPQLGQLGLQYHTRDGSTMQKVHM